MPPLSMPLSQQLHVFTNPEVPEPHHLGFLMEVSLHRHD